MAPTDTLEELEELLEEELEVLRHARFDELEDLILRKESLVEALAQTPPHEADLARLRDKALRTATALEASRQGLSSAARRIAELARVDQPETYDSSGHRARLGPRAGTLEKRS